MSLCTAVVSSIGAAAALLLFAEIRPAGAELCPELDADAVRAMAGWQVPGVALGAVRDGRVVLRRTYGVRDTATGAQVTPQTLFAVGSIAKSLTGLAVAIAAEERLLALDGEVRAFLPGFPEKVALRHLLSHTAGWPRHDALWYLDAYGRRELPDRLARLPRFAAPGAVFQYNNVPFAAAGVALERATGRSWDVWVRRKILDPAGMTDAVTGVSGFREAPDRASPYFPGDNGRIAIPLRDSDPVAPAAGLYAHLDDMLRYASFLTGDGDGKVPATAVRTIRTPAAERYGLGLNLSTWRGREMAYHPGVIDGYSARLTLLPTL
ncbi:MAG: serine hydrolase domain-containing protein, partial [Rhodospirillaceae bacterium]